MIRNDTAPPAARPAEPARRAPRSLFPPRLALAIATASLVALAAAPPCAEARRVTLRGTNQPSDYESVRRALRTLSPGDTLVLENGTFDWSENVRDSTLVPAQPGGLPITVDRLTILGRGALLRGARDADGHPVRPERGTNAAFRNAPGANGVTIDGLILESFENAIVLVQADSLPGLAPPNALAAGSTGWTLRNLLVRKGPFGIAANGRHDGLRIEDCRFEMELPPRPPRVATLEPRRSPQEGSFAVSIRPFEPTYPGVSRNVTVARNEVQAPARRDGREMFGGMLVTARGGTIAGNSVRDYGLGLVVEGTGLDVRGNTLTGNRIGVVAWTTSRRGLVTDDIDIADNDVRSCGRQNEGFLADFSGTGILLSGVSRSRIEKNRFAANVGSDIVLGALRGSRPSTGNRIADNAGTVTLTTASREANDVSGSRVRILSPPEPPKKTTAPPATPPGRPTAPSNPAPAAPDSSRGG